ncbi:IMP dehydrogenase [bacterium]|jgi:IMP dehydrogenase/GMP reductase|nr:IMP dehydrogenase [bacterium]
MNKLQFDFDDILIEPAVISNINSRSEINTFYDNNLPIFTAPMFDVISIENSHEFKSRGINTIIPRSTFDLDDIEVLSEKYGWMAVSLEEFDFLINDRKLNINDKIYILIDIANGHMERLHTLSKQAKDEYGDKLVLMVGNVANPHTYKILSDIGVDYIRIGIGFGAACLTTQQTSIGYTMASLIDDCKKISHKCNTPAKIVADGGMQKYSDIIKAIALGSDFVMLGSILNKTLESASDTYIGNKKYNSWTEPGDKIDQYNDVYKNMLKSGTKFYKKFRGMSTKEIQKEIKPDGKLKTSEGIVKLQEVEYTLSQWVENFNDYLKSAMSYTNCRNLEEFKNDVEYNFISQNSLNRFKK